MTGPCPHCGRPLPVPIDPVADMRAWLRLHDHWVGPSDTVTEAAAAAALNRAPNTLRGWRATDRRLPYRKTAAGVRYAITDLVEFAKAQDD